MGATPVIQILRTSLVIQKRNIPGLFITGTDTGVGKTVVASAIADWFRRRGIRVGVLKPVATGVRSPA